MVSQVLASIESSSKFWAILLWVRKCISESRIEISQTPKILLVNTAFRFQIRNRCFSGDEIVITVSYTIVKILFFHQAFVSRVLFSFNYHTNKRAALQYNKYTGAKYPKPRA